MIHFRVSTGVNKLDSHLQGGLFPARVYLIRGKSGTGKTTLGLKFLTANNNKRETSLHVTFSELETHLRYRAYRNSFNLQNVSFLDLSAENLLLDKFNYEDIYSSKLERFFILQQIIGAIQLLKPSRLFIDSASPLYIDDHERSILMSFLQFVSSQGTTIMLTTLANQDKYDQDIQHVADGILQLQRKSSITEILVTKFSGIECFNNDSIQFIKKDMPNISGQAYCHDVELNCPLNEYARKNYRNW